MTRRDIAALLVMLVASIVGIVQAWTVPGAGTGALLLVGVAVVIAALITEPQPKQ